MKKNTRKKNERNSLSFFKHDDDNTKTHVLDCWIYFIYFIKIFVRILFIADVNDDIDITHKNMALLKEIEFLLYFDFCFPSPLFTYE